MLSIIKEVDTRTEEEEVEEVDTGRNTIKFCVNKIDKHIGIFIISFCA